MHVSAASDWRPRVGFKATLDAVSKFGRTEAGVLGDGHLQIGVKGAECEN